MSEYNLPHEKEVEYNLPHEKEVEYNLPHEKGVDRFKWYRGRYVDTMPQLLSEGRSPLSIAGVIGRRLELKDGPEDVRSQWMEGSFETSDLKVQRGDDIKIVLTTHADGTISQIGKKCLGFINSDERLVNSAVNLGIDNRYEMLAGEGVFEMKRIELAYELNRNLTKDQAESSIFWRIVLRHPNEVPDRFAVEGLYNEAIDYIFGGENKRHNSDTMMEIYTNPHVYSPELRAWSIDRNNFSFNANGEGGLDTKRGCIVGLAPKVQGSSSNEVRQAIMYSPKQIREALDGLGLPGLKTGLIEQLEGQ